MANTCAHTSDKTLAARMWPHMRPHRSKVVAVLVMPLCVTLPLSVQQHPASKSARPYTSEAKDAHQPHSGGIRSARAGKKRGPRMVSRRPATAVGAAAECSHF
eukprot:359311-Chlamydomonas_euryale.AAC.4